MGRGEGGHIRVGVPCEGGGFSTGVHSGGGRVQSGSGGRGGVLRELVIKTLVELILVEGVGAPGLYSGWIYLLLDISTTGYIYYCIDWLATKMEPIVRMRANLLNMCVCGYSLTPDNEILGPDWLITSHEPTETSKQPIRTRYLGSLFRSSNWLSANQGPVFYDSVVGPRFTEEPGKSGSTEPTETSKQPIRTRYLGQVTGYQPIRDQYFMIRLVPATFPTTHMNKNTRAKRPDRGPMKGKVPGFGPRFTEEPGKSGSTVRRKLGSIRSSNLSLLDFTRLNITSPFDYRI
eukprot:sb/3467648/